MKDREPKTPSYVEVLKNEFLNHLDSVEFGSKEYEAYSDYYALEYQKDLRRSEIRNARGSETLNDLLVGTSELRITETRIALLENEIEQRRNRDTGYSKAFNFVEEKMGEVYRAIHDEVKAEYSDISDEMLLKSISDVARENFSSMIDDATRNRFTDITTDAFRDRLFRLRDSQT